ncbi:MAG: phosphate/phosphite/phosphonate ABC transporter substrate-binding protein [Nitrospirota bacterium]|nr:phosphate/phosphite/phosphonate ABC transporter substrate-binding protein [Nitrospirota bacterium]
MMELFNKFIRLTACLILCFAVLISVRHADAADVYSFGVVPQFEQRKLHAIWKPIIDEIEKRTGLHFNLISTLQIQDFEKEFVSGRLDFAYMNPYHVLKAADLQGYIPLVRDKVLLRGIIVTHKDSPIKDVTELDGKEVAFPSPNAIGACMLPRAELERKYHVKVVPLYVKTHSSVYLHVAKELAVAGGGVEKTFQQQDQSIRDALRILYTTTSFPPHPVAAHPRVPQEDREKVRQAFIELYATKEGKELLSKVPIKEIVSTTMDDYKVMRDLRIDEYWDPFWSEN